KHDFVFVVDDDRTYHTLRDFKSKQAAADFTALQQDIRQLKKTELELEQKRNAYATADDKSALASQIIALEQTQLSLQQSIDELTVKVRNEEIDN
ncbi:MAG: hypothetical protein Q4E55_09260, partial [Bacteroidales bacterium]|nr:hypothetical protein [Bacteroidales bacterium]